MATKLNKTGGASAPSNIVRLPTAASRQPKNHRYAAQRETRIALKKETAHRFGYKHHQARAAEIDAQTWLETHRTPALLIVEAMFKHLPAEAQEEVMRSVDLLTARGTNAHAQAMLTLKLSRPMTVGQCLDFSNALSAISRHQLGVVELEEGS